MINKIDRLVVHRSKQNLTIEGYVIIFNSVNKKGNLFDKNTVINIVNPIYLLFEHNLFNKKGIISDVIKNDIGVFIQAKIFENSIAEVLELIKEGFGLSIGFLFGILKEDKTLRISEVSLVKQPAEESSKILQA